MAGKVSPVGMIFIGELPFYDIVFILLCLFSFIALGWFSLVGATAVAVCKQPLSLNKLPARQK